jgi:hypothetical protein
MYRPATKKFCCFFFLGVLLYSYSAAQEFVYKNFNTKNGLPSNETHFVYEDKKGYIWICTDAGIAKYNANSFKIFDSSVGLPDNTIFEVKEDNLGRIWFRSFSGNIGYILHDSVFTIGANDIIRRFIREGIVSSFYVDEEFNLFLGKQNKHPNSFLKIKPPYDSLDVEEIHNANGFGLDIIIENSNTIIFSDAREISRKFYQIRIYDANHNLLARDSMTFFETSPRIHNFIDENEYYLSIGMLLKKYDLRKKSVRTYQKKHAVMSVISLDPDKLLVGGVKTGTSYYLKSKMDSAYLNNLMGKTITCISKDFQGGLWISTLEAGVYYLRDEKIKKYVVGYEKENAISHLNLVDKNNLLVGFSNGSIYKVGLSEDGINKIEKLFEDRKNEIAHVNSSLKIGKKTLVSGMRGHLVFEDDFRKVSCVFKHPTLDLPYVFRRMLRQGDRVFLSHIKDIFSCDTNFTRMKLIKEIDGRILSLAYDSISKVVYIGTLRGLYKYSESDPASRLIKVSEARIEDMKFAKGQLIMATKAGGVIVLRNDSLRTISAAKGLLSDFCKTVCIDGNSAWITTNKGISKIVFEGNEKTLITNYPIDYFGGPNYAEGTTVVGKTIYFYSNNQIYSFVESTGEIRDRFYLSSFSVDGEFLNPDDFASLKHNVSNLKISYEALFYKCHEKIKYRYKIGDQWNYTYETSISFPLLSPGNYEIYFEALNSDQKWIKADKVVRFTIERPFWAQLWFITLEIITIAGVISSLFYYRYKKILKKEHEKNKIQARFYELETRAIKAQMNPHFIFNSMNAIQRFILEGDMDNAHLYLTKFSRLIRKMMEHSFSDSIFLNEELDILNEYFEIEKLRFDSLIEFEMRVDQLDVNMMQIPFMIVQPFVENAIWHGLLNKEGERKLKVNFKSYDEGRIMCTVDDNGVGRETSSKYKNSLKEKSMAIDFIKQRLDLIGKLKKTSCSVNIIDKKNEAGYSLGTKVEIIIPKMN